MAKSLVTLGIVAFLLTPSCDSGNGDSGICAQRSGTYRMSYTERTGTCGVIPEQMATIDAQPTAPPSPCTSGEIRYSTNNCEVTNVNIVCPEDGVAAGDTSTTNGKYKWSGDGASGTGEMNIVLRDSSGQVICQSSYSLIATRL